MLRLGKILIAALTIMLGLSAAFAADNVVVRVAPSPPPVTAVLLPIPDEVIPAAVVEPVPTGPVVGPPNIAFGCKRIWRCDAQVCEWRRGCQGIYGYVEAPYYSKPLAERQWTRDYLPGPDTNVSVSSRRRIAVDPQLK
jgi:hypothetical protein